MIDNNSNDRSKDYIESLKNENITLIKTNNFGSIAKSRNLGIDKSKGDWICFLDADDYWHYEKLQNVQEAIMKEKPDMVSHDEFVINQNNEIISHISLGAPEKESGQVFNFKRQFLPNICYVC